MPLHPEIELILNNFKMAGAPKIGDLSPTEGRALFAQLTLALPPSTANLAGTRDMEIPGPAGTIPIRIYTPEGTGPFPILVFFHGGGWVLGDIECYDNVCRELCAGSRALVVSVDYRLAPEHRFPAAADDCVAATRWVGTNAPEINGDVTRMAVGGDSAGGNLAAVTALRLRDEGGPALMGQLLIYPVVTHPADEMASMTENAEGYMLTREDMDWFWAQYVGTDAKFEHPYATPLYAKSLKGLPAALVITAEFDPLRDEGEAYGRKLQQAGVSTRISRYDGAIHGFFAFYAVAELGRRGLDEANQWLRDRFAAKRTQPVA